MNYKQLMLSETEGRTPPPIEFHWCFVTPEIAKRILSEQVHNRRIKRGHADRLVKDSKEGRYVHTHQAMCFDVDGKFRDGQHRLTMIVESGIGQWMPVAFGVPREALPYIDAGVPRSIRDAIVMMKNGEGGDLISNRAVAIARVIETLPAYASYNYTRTEIIEILHRASEAIGFAVSSRCKGFTRTIRALVARAYMAQRDEERLGEFVQVVTSGFPVSESSRDDSAAITYRNLLARFEGMSGQAADLEKYRKGQTCLQAFLNRNAMTKTYGTKDDLFPLPEWWDSIAQL